MWIQMLIATMALTVKPHEHDYYTISTIREPDNVVLEVGGIAVLGPDEILVSTRRGEVYRVRDLDASEPTWTLFAEGLQEPLGLLNHDGWIYTVQRGELSRMRDQDNDGRMDELQTVCDDWRISGNYHEYAFGPRLDGAGNFWITLNKPFGSEPFGRQLWRGWAVYVTPEGEMVPAVAGLRSPAGVQGSPEGEMFYTDNQGEWCGASKLAHLAEGEFHGHPWGIDSAHDPRSRVEHPGTIPDGLLMHEVVEEVPHFKLPAVWFPYGKMGKSPAGMVWDTTDGKFGPYQGQVFVGDQHDSSLLRVALEKVDGHWQGACFPFLKGLDSGVIRVAWMDDGSIITGSTNRGWASLGNRPYSLQRVAWNGKVPFDIQRMSLTKDGFQLRFTKPVDIETAADPSSYRMQSYTYKLHSPYGSPEVDRKTLKIRSAEVSQDRREVHLSVLPLREGYVHELIAEGVRSESEHSLLHPDAYYTLIRFRPSSDDEEVGPGEGLPE